MPMVIPLILPALLSAGVGFGVNELSKIGQPSAGDQEKQMEAEMKQQAQADAQKQAQQEQLAKGQALRKAAPDAQAATGGSLTDAPFAQLTSNIAGMPGDIQEALKLLGHGGGSGDSQPGLSGGF